MPGHQLDILALEPFYGGTRRAMLETLIHYSRHRWTLLKLPPRRIERRLTTAAHWFAEQLSRHWAGSVDLLFTSEAMNLSDLLRLTPVLQHKPSVVYFHANQLPEPGSKRHDGMAELANLSTATAANEIWFNSQYHQTTFMERASALVARHPELSMRNPIPDLMRKSRQMTLPLDLSLIYETVAAQKIPRDRRMLLVDTRDADVHLLNAGLTMLQSRGETFSLTTIGPVDQLTSGVQRTTLIEHDDYGQTFAMFQSGVVLSTKTLATCDLNVIRGACAGCWPVAPRGGVYEEIIPETLQGMCLYEPSPQAMAECVQQFWRMESTPVLTEAMDNVLKRFDAIGACRQMDNRLEELAQSYPARR